jgi:hypothetical protein
MQIDVFKDLSVYAMAITLVSIFFWQGEIQATIRFDIISEGKNVWP